MKALVTGGAGFIGSHLVDYLVEKGLEVTVVDDLSMGNLKNIHHIDEVTVYIEDVRNKKFIQQLLQEEKPDYIYFLAAVASVADSIERPAETHSINHTAVFDMLEYIRKVKLPIKQFLFSSSAAVYGNLPELPKKEDSRVDPLTPYAIDKYSTERFVLAYGSLYNLPTVCVRFFNVYGPGQNPDSPYSGVLSILTECFDKNKKFTLFGDGEQTRDFVYIDDVIDALWIITKNKALHEVFNVADGSKTSLNSIIKIYEGITNRKIEIDRGNSRAGDVKQSIANIDKLLNLGYFPKWSLTEGLGEYWGEMHSETN